MTLAMPDLDLEALTFIEEEESHACQHIHEHGKRGHSDHARIMNVMGIPLPCCGWVPRIEYLCESWINSNSVLRCSRCNVNGLLFEECYLVLGPA